LELSQHLLDLLLPEDLLPGDPERLALFCGATTTLAECDDDEVRNFDEGRRPPSSFDSSSPPKLVMYVICPEFTGECDRERERDLD
jgi:hypothetical protein